MIQIVDIKQENIVPVDQIIIEILESLVTKLEEIWDFYIARLGTNTDEIVIHVGMIPIKPPGKDTTHQYLFVQIEGLSDEYTDLDTDLQNSLRVEEDDTILFNMVLMLAGDIAIEYHNHVNHGLISPEEVVITKPRLTSKYTPQNEYRPAGCSLAFVFRLIS